MRAVLISIVTLNIIASAPATEPEKLTKLKESYKAARTKALAPLEMTYLQELERLKIEFTRAGKLEDALAVDAELKTLQPDEERTLKVSSESTSDGKFALIARRLVGPTWHWANDQRRYTFNADGTCLYSNSVQKHQVKTEMNWVIRDGIVEVTGPNANKPEVYFEVTSQQTLDSWPPDKRDIGWKLTPMK